MNVADVAKPEAFVVAVFWPLAKRPLGPEPGALKVTIAPGTEFPEASRTATIMGAGKLLPTVTL